MVDVGPVEASETPQPFRVIVLGQTSFVALVDFPRLCLFFCRRQNTSHNDPVTVLNNGTLKAKVSGAPDHVSLVCQPAF